MFLTKCGRPTDVNLIAKVIQEYIDGYIAPGIYNLQNDGIVISKYNLAKFVRKTLDSHKHISFITTNLLTNAKAKRQLNSYLCCLKLDYERGKKRENWQFAVRNYLKQLYPDKFNKTKKEGFFTKLWKKLHI